jgi:hypothetical protein
MGERKFQNSKPENCCALPHCSSIGVFAELTCRGIQPHPLINENQDSRFTTLIHILPEAGPGFE